MSDEETKEPEVPAEDDRNAEEAEWAGNEPEESEKDDKETKAND